METQKGHLHNSQLDLTFMEKWSKWDAWPMSVALNDIQTSRISTQAWISTASPEQLTGADGSLESF